MRFVMKTRQDNDMTDCIGAFYAKKDIELLWPIGLDAVCDEYQRGQWHDQSYRCSLHQKWYWTIVIDRIL